MTVESKLKQLTADFDMAINEVYAEYTALHEELNKWAGKCLEEEEVPEVNKLLTEVQNRFAELHVALNLILYRHQFAVNVTKEYEKFIATLIEAGAKQTNPERSPEVPNGE